MYLQLGTIQFEGLYGPESMELSGSANYAEHALVEGKPLLQRLGSRLGGVTLSLKLHRQFTVPEDRITELEAAMADGTIMALITGAGDVLGDFVITDISRSMMRLADDGSIIEAGISVSLREYTTPDRATRVRNASRRNAFALSENNPVPAASGATMMIEREASEDVTQVATNSVALEDSTARAESFPAQEAIERKKMEFSLRKMLEKAASAKSICDGFSGDLFTNTRDLDTDLIAIISQGESLLALILAGDALTTLRTAVDAIMIKVRDMKSSAAFLNAFNARRQ